MFYPPQHARRPSGQRLAALIPRQDGVPMEEAIAKADEAGLAIASNKSLSLAMLGSEEQRALPCWTGTMAAYEKPGRKVGRMIEYRDTGTGIRYVFPVPEEHQGKKNIILIAEHPNFRILKEKKERIVQASEVGVVERFPASREGWHLGDPKYDLPQGNIADCRMQEARYFWRIEIRVGLVARDDGNGRGGVERRGINLGNRPSLGLGVLVENP